jgi:predicted RNase H-like HicB family nuclease
MITNKIILKDNQVVSVSIQVNFFKDNRHGDIVARCPALRITTYGKNMEHAKEMFKEAFELWLETTNEDCDAREILKNLDWRIVKSKATSITKREFPKMPRIAQNCLTLNTPSLAWIN